MNNRRELKHAVSIIPARGGSKRVLNKNIKMLGGEPLISFAVKAALKCTHIDQVLVSTDSEEIAQVAISCGASVPYLRPSHLAGDEIPADAAIAELVSSMRLETKYQYVVINPPTSPFVKPEQISACIELLDEHPELDTVMTVTTLDHRHHPFNLGFPVSDYQWQFSSADERLKYKSRQSKPLFHKFCNVFVTKVEQILSGTRFGKKIGFVELQDMFSQDMDTELDFVIAEAILKEYGKDKLC